MVYNQAMARGADDKEPLLSRIIRFFSGEQTNNNAIEQQRRDDRAAKEALLLNEIRDTRVNYDNLLAIKDLRLGKVHVHAMFKISNSFSTRNGLRVTRAIIYDETGQAQAVWFNTKVGPLMKLLTIYDIRGTFKLSSGRLQIISPTFKPLDEGCDLITLAAAPITEQELQLDDGRISNTDSIDELNKVVEREIMDDALLQDIWAGEDRSKLGEINESTNQVVANFHGNSSGAKNKAYSKQEYSLTRDAPKNWEHTDINLNSQRISPNSFWGRLRIQVWNRDNYSCQEKGCSNEDWLTVHHTIELSLGGTNEISNLMTLCRKHHEEIHGKKIYNTGKDFKNLDNYGKDYVLTPKIIAIRDAIEKHEDLAIDYNDIRHTHTNRRITPLRLYIKNNKKYLEAYCHLRNAKRTFRVVRIQIAA